MSSVFPLGTRSKFFFSFFILFFGVFFFYINGCVVFLSADVSEVMLYDVLSMALVGRGWVQRATRMHSFTFARGCVHNKNHLSKQNATNRHIVSSPVDSQL